MSEQKSFFSTLPGIITALAGLVTAIASLVLALSQSGLIGPPGEKGTFYFFRSGQAGSVMQKISDLHTSMPWHRNFDREKRKET